MYVGATWMDWKNILLRFDVRRLSIKRHLLRRDRSRVAGVRQLTPFAPLLLGLVVTVIWLQRRDIVVISVTALPTIERHWFSRLNCRWPCSVPACSRSNPPSSTDSLLRKSPPLKLRCGWRAAAWGAVSFSVSPVGLLHYSSPVVLCATAVTGALDDPGTFDNITK